MEQDSKRKFLVIVNPRAGNYVQAVVGRQFSRFFATDAVSAELHYFVDQETLAKRIEAAIDEGVESFVAAGGDGLVALVATCLQARRRPIGIIPLGTSNMLGQILGIPVNIGQAVDVLASSRRTRTIDGLKIGDRLFFMNASMGLSSYSVKDVTSLQKSLLKRSAYVLAVVRSMRRARVRVYSLEIDGKAQQVEAAELFIANAGSLVAPRYTLSDSDFNDGRFEVCMVRKATWPELFSALLDLFVRKKKRSILLIKRGGRITVSCEEVLPVQADGDFVTETPVTVEIVPGAATFIVP